MKHYRLSLEEALESATRASMASRKPRYVVHTALSYEVRTKAPKQPAYDVYVVNGGHAYAVVC